MSEDKIVEKRKFKLSNWIDKHQNLLTIFIFSLLSSIIVLAFYVLVVAKNLERPIAAVDIQSIMKDITSETFKEMAKSSANQQENVAQNSIKSKTATLEAAIVIVEQRHHAILVQKQAFASINEVEDYTNEVKNEMAKLK